MTDERNKAVVRRYFSELWNKGHLDVADEILAQCFGGEGGAMSGLEAAKLYVSSYRAAFPSIHFRLLSLVCQENLVVACWVGTGAHEASENCPDGAKMGRERTITGLSVYRIEDGKITEMWGGCGGSAALNPTRKSSIHSKN